MTLWLLLLQGGVVHAGHITGNSITYSCIGTCTLRVEFKAYRDCSSPITNVTPLNTVSITSNPGCTLPTALSAWQNLTNVEVTPVCPGTPTRCSSPSASFAGIMEHYWVRDYDFCASNCNQYSINWTTCCRNSGITTIANPASVALYASTSFNPLLSPCNSSPSFLSPPIAYICQGQPHVVRQGAVDADGDSLSYAMGPCLRGPNQSIPYLAFTSPSSPLGPDWTVSLAANGDLSLLPNSSGPNPGSIQVGVICIYVTEWRNGIVINTIQRDMQVSVIACPPNNRPVVQAPNNVSGGSSSNFTLTTCVGASLCADFRVSDPDASQLQTLYWDQALANMGATFVSTANGSIQDTVIGSSPSARFCWMPAQAGTYTFNVQVQDDACPIVAQTYVTVTVVVYQIETRAQSQVAGCRPVTFCAEPLSGTWPYRYAWQGGGGLGSAPSDSCISYLFPGSGAYPFSVHVTDALGCTASFEDTVHIVNNVQANAGGNATTCAFAPIQIGMQGAVSPNWIFSWTPSSQLDDPSLPFPVFTSHYGGSSPVMQNLTVLVTDTMTGCSARDTVSLSILPIPQATISLPDTTCISIPVHAVAQASLSGPPATFLWSTAGGIPGNLSGSGSASFHFLQPGYQYLNVQAIQNGCSSLVVTDSIWIESGPQAQISPVSDQCISGNQFSFSVSGSASPTASFQWTFGPNASPSSSSSASPTNITFANVGTKYAILQLSESGCPGPIDTVYFQVLPNPNPNWMVIGGSQCFDGNQFQFQTTGNNSPQASYFWTFQDGIPASSLVQNPICSFSSPGMKVVTLTVTTSTCTATRTDSVAVFEIPQVDAGPSMVMCEGDTGVSLITSASSGSGPYYYQWNCATAPCHIDSIYDDDPIVAPEQTTYYYVQVIDVNGCYSLMDSVLVTVNSRPVADAGPDRFICGDTAPCQTLLGNIIHSAGPTGYAWAPATGLNGFGSLQPCADPDTTTTYTLVATDLSTGCRSLVDSISTVTVSVSDIPVAQAGPDLNICPGDSAVLIGNAAGAGPAYSYLWEPSIQVVHPNKHSTFAFPPNSTIFTFSVWSNGCESEPDTVQVNVHDLPSVDAGGNREICLGDSTLLDASAMGDSTGNYSFTWLHGTGLSNPNTEDPIAVPYTSTTYVVMVTSSWGCESVPDSVQVHLLPTPVADAGPDLTVCEGQTAILEGTFSFTTTDSAPSSEVSFAWTPRSLLSDTALLRPSLMPYESGWYHLTATFGACTTHDSTYLNFIPNLNAQVHADTSRICAGDSVLLSAVGGHGTATASWSPALSLGTMDSLHTWAFPASSTTYTMILSESGCSDTAQFLLSVLPRPASGFTHSPLEGCVPFPVSFMGSNGGSDMMIWDFGDGGAVSNATNPVHIFESSGQFQVTLTAVGSGMCATQSAPVTVVVHPPPPIALAEEHLFPMVLYLPNALLDLEEISPGSQNVFWEFGDGMRGEGNEVTHIYQSAGTYTIELLAQSAEGCVDSMQFGPVLVREPELDIPNVFSPNGDGVNDELRVDYQGNEPFLMHVNDRWGNRIFESRDWTTGWNGKDPAGKNTPEGVYFYEIQIGGRSYAGPVTLMR